MLDNLSSITVNPQLIIAFIGGIVVVYLAIRFLSLPLKILSKTGIILTKGALAVLVINVVGQFFNYIIPFNIANILIAGGLGWPGLVTVIAIKHLLA